MDGLSGLLRGLFRGRFRLLRPVGLDGQGGAGGDGQAVADGAADGAVSVGAEVDQGGGRFVGCLLCDALCPQRAEDGAQGAGVGDGHGAAVGDGGDALARQHDAAAVRDDVQQHRLDGVQLGFFQGDLVLQLPGAAHLGGDVLRTLGLVAAFGGDQGGLCRR